MINDLGVDMIPLKDAVVKYQVEGSSDFGNCTYIAPGIQTLFAIDAPDTIHTTTFRDAAGTMFAHDAALRAGKGNAFVGIDVLIDDTFFNEVRSEFEDTMKEARRL